MSLSQGQGSTSNVWASNALSSSTTGIALVPFTSTYDPLLQFNTPSAAFVALVAGYYFAIVTFYNVTLSTTGFPTAPAHNTNGYIYKNGSPWVSQNLVTSPAGTSTTPTVLITSVVQGIVFLNAGEYVQFVFGSLIGVTETYTANASVFKLF